MIRYEQCTTTNTYRFQLANEIAVTNALLRRDPCVRRNTIFYLHPFNKFSVFNKYPTMLITMSPRVCSRLSCCSVLTSGEVGLGVARAPADRRNSSTPASVPHTTMRVTSLIDPIEYNNNLPYFPQQVDLHQLEFANITIKCLRKTFVHCT